MLTRALDDSPDVRKEARSQLPAGIAPASGLTLVDVCYDDLV
jgi:hypothetical protein